MPLTLEVWSRFWRYREPFRLSRGVELGQDTVQVALTDECGNRGRGEAVGVTYAGETVAGMIAQLASGAA